MKRNIHEIIYSGITVFTTAASIASFHSYLKGFDEKNQIFDAIKETKGLEKQVSDLYEKNIGYLELKRKWATQSEEYYELKPKLANNLMEHENILAITQENMKKYEALCELSQKNQENNFNSDLILKLIEELRMEQYKNISRNIGETTEKMREMRDHLENTNFNKFLNNNDSSSSFTVEQCKEIFANFQEYLLTLNHPQVGALGHILAATGIILCLLSLISVFYGDVFLNDLDLETRFPKLARFIKLRRVFLQYYFLLYTLIILFLALMIIFVNIKIFYLNSND